MQDFSEKWEILINDPSIEDRNKIITEIYQHTIPKLIIYNYNESLVYTKEDFKMITFEKIFKLIDKKRKMETFEHFCNSLIRSCINEKNGAFKKTSNKLISNKLSDEDIFDEFEYDDLNNSGRNGFISRSDYLKTMKAMEYKSKFEKYKELPTKGAKNCYKFLKTLLDNSKEYCSNGFKNLIHQFDLNLDSNDQQKEEALRQRKSECFRKFRLFINELNKKGL